MIVILTIYPLLKVAGQPGPDSGYVSHSSGGGYPKLQVGKEDNNYNDYGIGFWMPMPVLKTSFIQVPMSSAVKSFTMSMDRGFLGGAQNTNNHNNDNYKNNLGLTYQLNRMCP